MRTSTGSSKNVATIGLEIHAELRTATKMFCNSKNDPDELRPNVNVCPVCMAHPGTLPVINRAAIEHVLRVGVALGGTLADYTEFDRKNYFYPDLPKGYQISQYEFPLVSGGSLCNVAITRIHLEEDTASSMHLPVQAGDEQSGETHIDFNRAGVPLMELVTEPVIKSAEEAGLFARELQLLLRYLGASDADMEKGLMRVEANVSVAPATETADTRRTDAEGRGKIQRDSASHPRTSAILGTKVEVKNLNSFRAMERAVEYEIARQTKLLEKGEKVVQETRGWDEGKQATFAQRVKEGSADYRYFPDPDLPSLRLSDSTDFAREKIQASLPELPEARRNRYLALGIKKDDASAFVRDARLGTFFENVISRLSQSAIILAANYIANDLVKLLRDDEDKKLKAPVISLSPTHFCTLVQMIDERKISSRAAKDILAEMVSTNRDPQEVAHARNLLLASADDAEAILDSILGMHGEAVAQYKAGKTNALEFLVGQAMKAMKGAGNPTEIRERLRTRLAQL